MPLHYRCRCGQEVELRPREGLGLLLGGLLGLTLLNSVLLFVLWGSGGDTNEPVSPAQGRSVPSSEEGSGTLDGPDEQTSSRSLAKTPNRATSDPIDRKLDSEREAPLIRKDPRAVVSEASTNETGRLDPPSLEPRAAEPPVFETIELELRRPEGLHDEALAELYHAPPGPGLDRHLVLLALSRWGGTLAPRARDLLRVEVPRLADAFAPDEDQEVNRDTLLLRRTLERSDRHRAMRSELAAIDQVWTSRWRAMLDRIAADPNRGWRRAVAVADRPGPIDLVLLIDLSESMNEEIARLRAAMLEMVPELLRARPDLRLGWIGYRDEVVDRLPLTADWTVLKDSFDRLRAEGGGDVPEALDEALFEAFRVGGLTWRPEARHRFLVVGDAPPPYDRIEGMIELARAAHESPEGFVIDSLGIIREPEFPEILAFRALAEGTTGTVRFLEPKELSPETWWTALLSSGQPLWSDRPAADSGSGRD